MPTIPLTDERFAAAAERLPTTPQVYDRLSGAMKDPDVGVDEIVRVVRLDAALSARVLRLCNSAQYGRGDRVSDLSEAINRVGFQEVYRLVGAAMSAQLYIAGLPVYGVGGDELWLNSLTTALALESLADAVGEDRRVGYTLGLLRPVGRLVLQRLATTACCAPLGGRKATAALVNEWETSALGINNLDAVDRLFRLWQFPTDLAKPIRYHFNPTEDPARNRLTALLHVACWVSESLGKGLVIEKEAWNLSETVLLQAGLEVGVAEACAEITARSSSDMENLLRAA